MKWTPGTIKGQKKEERNEGHRRPWFFFVALPVRIIKLTFGVRGSVLVGIILWVVFGDDLADLGHLTKVGLDLNYLATGVLAALTSWILLSGQPLLFSRSYLVSVPSLFGCHGI